MKRALPRSASKGVESRSQHELVSKTAGIPVAGRSTSRREVPVGLVVLQVLLDADVPVAFEVGDELIPDQREDLDADAQWLHSGSDLTVHSIGDAVTETRYHLQLASA